jgi:tetratricopeptide (TPR) repeat protein
VRIDHRNPGPILCLCLAFGFVVIQLPEAQSTLLDQASLDQARNLVRSRTSPDQAKSLLAQAIAVDAKNAEAHFLLGQVLYAFADFAKASDEASKAVALDDSKSDYHLLLGNSLSGLLDSAGMFKKMSLARQIKAEFERAVAEDPKNIPAPRWPSFMCRLRPSLAAVKTKRSNRRN